MKFCIKEYQTATGEVHFTLLGGVLDSVCEFYRAQAVVSGGRFYSFRSEAEYNAAISHRVLTPRCFPTGY